MLLNGNGLLAVKSLSTEIIAFSSKKRLKRFRMERPVMLFLEANVSSWDSSEPFARKGNFGRNFH